MALENADGGGGDWIDDATYQQLCREKALAVLKILRIEDGSKPKENSRSMWYPVVVDLLVLSGTHEGTVWRAERMTKAGFTNTLREKFDPRDVDKKPKERRKIPRTEGTDLAARFGTYSDAEGNTRYCLNAARATDMPNIEKLFADTDGDPYSAAEKAEYSKAATAFAPEEYEGDGEIGSSSKAAPIDDDEPPF